MLKSSVELKNEKVEGSPGISLGPKQLSSERMARTKQTARKTTGGKAPRKQPVMKKKAARYAIARKGLGKGGVRSHQHNQSEDVGAPTAATSKELQARLEKIQNVFEEVSDDMMLTAVTAIEDSPDGLKCTRNNIREQIIKTHYKYRNDPTAVLSFNFDALFEPSFEEALKDVSIDRDLINKVERDGEEVYEKSANFHQEDLVGLTECEGCDRKVLMKAAQVCAGPGCRGKSARFCERCIGACVVCKKTMCHGVCRPTKCENCKFQTE